MISRDSRGLFVHTALVSEYIDAPVGAVAEVSELLADQAGDAVEYIGPATLAGQGERLGVFYPKYRQRVRVLK